VHVEEVAYAVSGTMTIVQPTIPECLAGQDVELATTCALGVLSQGDLDVSLQYESVVRA